MKDHVFGYILTLVIELNFSIFYYFKLCLGYNTRKSTKNRTRHEYKIGIIQLS